MRRVFARRGDAVRWTLEPWEPTLLRSLRDDLRALLEAGDADDPAVRRFSTPTVRGDADADAELRELIADELLGARLAGLDAIVGVLDRAEPRGATVRVDLVDDEPFLVLGVLNDVRLALGARVEVDRIDRDALSEDDPRTRSLAVMDHLAFLQEALLQVIDPVTLSHYDDHHDHDRPDAT